MHSDYAQKMSRQCSDNVIATDECPAAQDASRIRDVSEIQTPLPRAQARELMRDVPHPDDAGGSLLGRIMPYLFLFSIAVGVSCLIFFL